MKEPPGGIIILLFIGKEGMVMKSKEDKIRPEDREELFKVWKSRFEKNKHRHRDILWEDVQKKLENNEGKLWSLEQMEVTGGEPDVVGYDEKTDEYIFYDCAAESPKERRSLCYDRRALDSRKQAKPASSVMDMAQTMGIELLTEEEYRELQKLGKFDQKTSSWVKTPDNIRELGGAIFCDYRYGTVFVYHNGAESYYSSRGFRGVLKV